MVKGNRVLMALVIGLLCGWILFSASSRKAVCESAIPSSVSFSGESNVMYFLDRAEARIYRYNTQGRLTRTYIIEELGKDLERK